MSFSGSAESQLWRWGTIWDPFHFPEFWRGGNLELGAVWDLYPEMAWGSLVTHLRGLPLYKGSASVDSPSTHLGPSLGAKSCHQISSPPPLKYLIFSLTIYQLPFFLYLSFPFLFFVSICILWELTSFISIFNLILFSILWWFLDLKMMYIMIFAFFKVLILFH